jgi:hypothetical protein
VHHHLNSGTDRLKPSQPQQVQDSGSQRGHHSGAIAAIAVGLLMELGVADPVPAFNASAVSHQLQHPFWRGGQAGEEQVLRLKGGAVAAGAGRLLHDTAGADPALADVCRCLFGTQGLSDGAGVADLVIPCTKRDLAFSLELAMDLGVQRLLVGFHCQEEVGSLLLEMP